jgi:UDP-glucose 4-epimerase
MGAKVTIYDSLDPRSNSNRFNVQDIRQQVRLIIGDIRDPDAVRQAVGDQDFIFNCAAFTSHPMSMKEPLIDIDVNCKGVLYILEALKSQNSKAVFVQVGTSTQIGRMQYSPIDESHPEFPVDIYSANKTAAEKYVLIYANAHAMKTTVVRLANVFGPRSQIFSPDFGFVNYFVGLALQGKDMTVYGDGAQLRNISFVDDCVDALIAAAMDHRSIGHVFFATSDLQYSVLDIGNEISRAIGGRLRQVPWPEGRRAIDVGDAVISNEKIRRMLGWKPKHSLADGLVKTRDYFRTCIGEYIKTDK